MARKLNLKKFAVTNVNFEFIGAYRLRVVATDLCDSDTDPNVFLFRRDLPNPYTGTVQDTFFTICSPVDMAEYPVGGPDIALPYPFWRTNVIELDFRSVALADEAWTLIVREVDALLKALDRLELLKEVASIDVGTPPFNCSSSSSGSDSDVP